MDRKGKRGIEKDRTVLKWPQTSKNGSKKSKNMFYWLKKAKTFKNS